MAPARARGLLARDHQARSGQRDPRTDLCGAVSLRRPGGPHVSTAALSWAGYGTAIAGFLRLVKDAGSTGHLRIPLRWTLSAKTALARLTRAWPRLRPVHSIHRVPRRAAPAIARPGRADQARGEVRAGSSHRRVLPGPFCSCSRCACLPRRAWGVRAHRSGCRIRVAPAPRVQVLRVPTRAHSGWVGRRLGLQGGPTRIARIRHRRSRRSRWRSLIPVVLARSTA